MTDCGRARPVGAGSRQALGNGYVAEVDAALAASGIEPAVRVTNMGISGDTVRDLDRRWEADVVALRPDWLSVLIGINDVWRQFDGRNEAAAVMPGEYTGTLDRLVGRTKPAVAGLVLMSPFYVQPDRSDAMRRRMDEYGDIVRSLAEAHGAVFVDTQAAIDAALARMDFAAIAADRVHPTDRGHLILARAFLGALG